MFVARLNLWQPTDKKSHEGAHLLLYLDVVRFTKNGHSGEACLSKQKVAERINFNFEKTRRQDAAAGLLLLAQK
jgi:exonuclease III